MPQGDDVCTRIPVLPPGVSIGGLLQEARLLDRKALAFAGFKPMGTGGGAYSAARLDLFYDQVRNKGPWDLKQQGRQYEEAGNFVYGVTGKALRIPEQVLMRAAG